MNNGYKVVYMPEHHRAGKNGCVFEHILVAEDILGRPLRDTEVIHHRDKNRSNNDPSNIMVFASNGDHTAFHNGASVVKENGVWKSVKNVYEKPCEYCKRQFTTYDWRQKYCSHDCSSKGHRLLTDNIEQIVSCAHEHHGNMSAVGRLYGISANAVIKRLKSNNLPYHSKDYR